MRRLILSVAIMIAAPVAALPAAPAAQASHEDALRSMLRARLMGIELRIDMLRERQSLGGAEEQDLRDLSRDLERRIRSLSKRDVSDLESEMTLLETRVGYAIEDTRWSRRSLDESGDRHVDDEPYRGNSQGDYRHFDRYTAPPVDRWHDPFDRGSGL